MLGGERRTACPIIPYLSPQSRQGLVVAATYGPFGKSIDGMNRTLEVPFPCGKGTAIAGYLMQALDVAQSCQQRLHDSQNPQNENRNGNQATENWRNSHLAFARIHIDVAT